MNVKHGLGLISLLGLFACNGEADSLSTSGQSLDDSANGGTSSGRGGHHRGPPQVAIDACASLAEGDACSFTGPDGAAISSTCALGRDGATLVCVPPPPAELVAACSGLAEGDACSFTNPDGDTISSTCAIGHDGATLVCRPPRGDRGGDCGGPGGPGREGRGGHGPDRAALCSGLAAGDACSATAPDGSTIAGTCAVDERDGTTIVCVLPPPAELVNACSGLAEGDACTLTAPDGNSVSSTCRLARDGATLLCAPPHDGPHGRR